MSAEQLQWMADFYADLEVRWGMANNQLELLRDSSERLHMLATEPEGVTYKEVDANGVMALWAIPVDGSKDHAMIHSHSGGSVVSSVWMDRKAIGHLAKATGVPTLLVNFRLAPENPFPAIIDDVETAYLWLLEQGYKPENVASIGHSIGGNMAINLALTLKRHGHPVPAAVLAMSPWLDMTLSNETIDTHAGTDKQLSREKLGSFADQLLDGTGVEKSDPRINIQNADIDGLPPTFVYYGDQEILVDDSKKFAARVKDAGIEVEIRELPGGQHNFVLGAGNVDEIDEAVVVMAAWLKSKLGVSA